MSAMDIAETMEPKKASSRGRALARQTSSGFRKSWHTIKKPLEKPSVQAKVESITYKQCTSLEWSIYQNDLPGVNTFLGTEENVNRRDVNGNTPLHTAIALWVAEYKEYGSDVWDRYGVIKALVEHPRMRSASIYNDSGRMPQGLVPKSDDHVITMLRGLLFGRAQFEIALRNVLTAAYLKKPMEELKFADYQEALKYVTREKTSTLSIDDLAADVLSSNNNNFESQKESDREIPAYIQKEQVYIDETFVKAAIESWIKDHTQKKKK